MCIHHQGRERRGDQRDITDNAVCMGVGGAMNGDVYIHSYHANMYILSSNYYIPYNMEYSCEW